jgi:hypothetical protein
MPEWTRIQVGHDDVLLNLDQIVMISRGPMGKATLHLAQGSVPTGLDYTGLVRPVDALSNDE